MSGGPGLETNILERIAGMLGTRLPPELERAFGDSPEGRQRALTMAIVTGVLANVMRSDPTFRQCMEPLSQMISLLARHPGGPMDDAAMQRLIGGLMASAFGVDRSLADLALPRR